LLQAGGVEAASQSFDPVGWLPRPDPVQRRLRTRRVIHMGVGDQQLHGGIVRELTGGPPIAGGMPQCRLFAF